jgi:uncharacterized protein (DUF2141 family)
MRSRRFPQLLFPFPHGKGLGVRFLASVTVPVLIALLVVSIAAAQTPIPTPSASPQNPLDIEVIGLRNDSGEVGCSLFNDAQAFPRDDSKVLHHVWAPIHAGKAVCEFTDLAPGQYAAVVFHDENNDHQFNMNAFGMPMEGYGFSNDAAALFAPPDFKSAAFTYNGTHLYIVINIRY